MVFWLDFYKQGVDVIGEWNQYIFSKSSDDDMLREAIQSAYDTEYGDIMPFVDAESIARAYLEEKGFLTFNEETQEEELKTNVNEAVDYEKQKKIADETELDSTLIEIVNKCKEAYANKDIKTAWEYYDKGYNYIDSLFGFTGDETEEEYDSKFRDLSEEDRVKKATLNFKYGDMFTDKEIYTITDYGREKYYKENGITEAEDKSKF